MHFVVRALSLRDNYPEEIRASVVEHVVQTQVCLKSCVFNYEILQRGECH